MCLLRAPRNEYIKFTFNCNSVLYRGFAVTNSLAPVNGMREIWLLVRIRSLARKPHGGRIGRLKPLNEVGITVGILQEVPAGSNLIEHRSGRDFW